MFIGKISFAPDFSITPYIGIGVSELNVNFGFPFKEKLELGVELKDPEINNKTLDFYVKNEISINWKASLKVPIPILPNPLEPHFSGLITQLPWEKRYSIQM
ncbi:MAG: hypothetical protein MJ188_04690 [Treponema sp.]|nr:hypothetical protein [Treponema sp.]